VRILQPIAAQSAGRCWATFLLADLLTHLGVAYEKTGRHEDSVRVYNQITALAKTLYVPPVLFAMLRASMDPLGRRET